MITVLDSDNVCICTHTHSLFLTPSLEHWQEADGSLQGLSWRPFNKRDCLQRNSQSKGNKHGILKCQELATMGNIPFPCWRGQDQGAVAVEGWLHTVTSPGRVELWKITAWQEGGLGARWELIPWPLAPPTFWFPISAWHQPMPTGNQKSRNPGTVQAETESRSWGSYGEWPANSLLKNI